MINILISLSLALFSFEMFSLTSKISSLNKTMINIPLSLFSYSVPLVGKENLYFDKITLEDKLNEYFVKNIKEIINEYSLDYTYYSSTTSSICMSSYCDQVKITLDCQIDGLYSYHRAMKFNVGAANNG